MDSSKEQDGVGQPKHRVVVGVTGASGTPLALCCLRMLRDVDDVEVHLVASEAARMTASYELDADFSELTSLADVCYDDEALDAPISSGTFETAGMIVIPCSMKTVAGIASGYSDNLLLRAADVTIKEQRPLVLVAREAPLSAIHLNNLARLATLPGVSICPPVMSYYHQPKNISDMEHHLVGKALQQLGIHTAGFKRWSGGAL